MARRLQISYDSVTPFITKDGSIIRELMHPNVHGNIKQSLAEAIIPPESATVLHRHCRSEELYHVTAGEGLMRLDEDEFTVTVGDTICIPPGIAHCLSNPGQTELRLLCCSSPPYTDEDTELLEETA